MMNYLRRNIRNEISGMKIWDKMSGMNSMYDNFKFRVACLEYLS